MTSHSRIGKKTLARTVAGYANITFDDAVRFAADLPDRIVLDEIQHVPEFLSR